MELDTKGSGMKQLIRETEEVIRFGQTAHFMRDTGAMIKLMVAED
jgi:hypothetical protein